MKAIKVIAAVMSIVLLAGAAGCDSAGDSKAKKQMEETLDSYMQRVFDDRPAGRYVDTKEEATFNVTEEQNEICCAVQEIASYEVLRSEITEKDREGKILIEFKYADAEKISDGRYDYELYDIVDEIKKVPEKKKLKEEFEFKMVCDDGEWLVSKKSDAKFKDFLHSIVDDIELREEIIDPGVYAYNGKVGISMPTDLLKRWDDDGHDLQLALENMGYEVELRYADNSVATQKSQIGNLIASGCGVLVIAAIDSVSLADELALAAENGVTVIAYDRLIKDTQYVDYYMTFDQYAVGAIQATYAINALGIEGSSDTFRFEFTAGDPSDEYARLFYAGAYDVLEPYIDQGRIVVVSGQTDFMDVATAAWSTDKAQARAENILAAYYDKGDVIDAWICSNDSTALGVINALDGFYTGDKYPVITGQDCDIVNVKHILNGKQAMSVFKDTRNLVERTADIVDQILYGSISNFVPDDTTTYNNGKKTVPAFFCEPVFVNADNYHEILIDSGYYRESDFG